MKGISLIAGNQLVPKMRYIGQALVKGKKAPIRGEVFVISSRCKGCGLCWTYCPQEVLEESSDYNEKGFHYPKLKEQANKPCVNCGFCTLMCPEFAIHTITKDEYDQSMQTVQHQKKI